MPPTLNDLRRVFYGAGANESVSDAEWGFLRDAQADGVSAATFIDRIADPTGFGIITTADPIYDNLFTSVGVNNRGVFNRITGSGTITKLGINIGAQSGNISLAVYKNTGVGRAAKPGIRLATTGIIACPAVGFAEIALPGSISVKNGDWFALSASDTVSTFLCTTSFAAITNITNGRSYYQDAVLPFPGDNPAVLNGLVKPPVIIGIP